MNYTSVIKDLFTLPIEHVLIHCISTDCEMGAGIAKEFNRRYPKMKQCLRNQRPQIGQVLPYYAPDGRIIVNLITKDRYWNKPTREHFNATLLNLHRLIQAKGWTNIGSPLIGAGLDKLSWDTTEAFLMREFDFLPINLTVCRLK